MPISSANIPNYDQSLTNLPIFGQSDKPMPLLRKFDKCGTNLPIDYQLSVNTCPIHHQCYNSKPILEQSIHPTPRTTSQSPNSISAINQNMVGTHRNWIQCQFRIDHPIRSQSPILDQSSNPLPILDQTTNPMPIRKDLLFKLNTKCHSHTYTQTHTYTNPPIAGKEKHVSPTTSTTTKT